MSDRPNGFSSAPTEQEYIKIIEDLLKEKSLFCEHDDYSGHAAQYWVRDSSPEIQNKKLSFAFYCYKHGPFPKECDLEAGTHVTPHVGCPLR